MQKDGTTFKEVTSFDAFDQVGFGIFLSSILFRDVLVGRAYQFFFNAMASETILIGEHIGFRRPLLRDFRPAGAR